MFIAIKHAYEFVQNTNKINCTNSNKNDKLNITVKLYQNKNATKDEICIKTDFHKITLIMYCCHVRQHNLSLFAFACSNSRCQKENVRIKILVWLGRNLTLDQESNLF